MVEANPWWKNLPSDRGELPASYGSTGVKADGGGSMAGRGNVGPMRLHRACNLRDMEALTKALDGGDDVNEVEAVRLPRLFTSSPRRAPWPRLRAAAAAHLAQRARSRCSRALGGAERELRGCSRPRCLAGWQHAAAQRLLRGLGGGRQGAAAARREGERDQQRASLLTRHRSPLLLSSFSPSVWRRALPLG
jgi:hypothetical protein